MTLIKNLYHRDTEKGQNEKLEARRKERKRRKRICVSQDHQVEAPR
jgi:hypothetical protein